MPLAPRNPPVQPGWADFAPSGHGAIFRQLAGASQPDSEAANISRRRARRKVSERPEWTRGLFVSFAGFAEVGLQALRARKIILADGMDIYEALARRLSIPDVIAAKIRHVSEYRNPFERVRSLFPLGT
jgi:hypothetical protein